MRRSSRSLHLPRYDSLKSALLNLREHNKEFQMPQNDRVLNISMRKVVHVFLSS